MLQYATCEVIEQNMKKGNGTGAGLLNGGPDASRDLIMGLPNTIFSPLASPARRSYARLLLRIQRDFLDTPDGLEQLSQAQVVEIVKELMEKGEEFDRDDEFAPDAHNAKLSVKPSNVYRRLVDAGWFFEIAVGFETFVSIPRSVSLLLAAFDRIEKGETINFRGSIQLVQTVLDRLKEEPFEAAMLLEQAARSSDAFKQSMKILLDDIQANETKIMRMTKLSDMVAIFFDEFAKSLITDYSALKSKYNPIRIADAVIASTAVLLAEESKIFEIARGYVKFGLTETSERGEQMVRSHLEEISRIFSNVHMTLAEIDAARLRVEERFVRAIDFERGVKGTELDAISECLGHLGQMNPEDEFLGLESQLIYKPGVFGEHTMRMPKVAKAKVKSVAVRERKNDARISRAVENRNALVRKLFIEPDELDRYLEELLGDRDSIRIEADFESDLRKMIMLSKARSVASYEEGILSHKFGFEPDGGLMPGNLSMFSGGTIVRNKPTPCEPRVISRFEPRAKVKKRVGKRSAVR